MARPDDGRDTALARLLLARGLLDVGTLRTCLDEVRRRRDVEPEVSLPDVLLARGAVSREALEQTDTLVGVAQPAPPPAAAPTFAGYRVVRELARGGMGRLFEAEHEVTGARRALKTILTGGASAEDVLRFRREAELLARLDHPAIVRVHTASLGGPTPFLVMDLLPGGSLQERLDRGPLPVADAVSIAAALARGLEHAHARGVLHRDLKPRNVVFDEQGRARLVDLGLARPLEASSLTMSGTILGTPSFMAPEQAAGSPADERTDVFGLGAVLYAMLTGRAPHAGQGALAMLAAALRATPEPIRALRPEVPRPIERACARAMAAAPEDRFPTAASLAEALEALANPLAPPSSSLRSLRAVVGASALVFVVALAGVALSQRPTTADRPPAPPRSNTALEAPAAGTASIEPPAATAWIETAVVLAPRGGAVAALEAAARAGPAGDDVPGLSLLARWLDEQALLRDLRAELGEAAGEVARALATREAALPALEESDPLELQDDEPHLAQVEQLVHDVERLPTDRAALRALRRRAQQVAGRSLFRIGLRLRSDTKRSLVDLAERTRALGPDGAFADGLLAWIWCHDDEARSRAALARLHEQLPGQYGEVADCARLVRRVPHVTLERGEELFAALAPVVGRLRGFHPRHVGRELGRLHRLEAWRLRRSGATQGVAPALARALELGRAAAEGSTGAELEELVITLLADGRFEEARVEVQGVTDLLHRRLLEAERRLALDDPTAAAEFEAVLNEGGDYVEVFVGLAHARSRAGDARWVEALEAASRPGRRTVGIEWHSLEHAREVIEGQGWWPGRRRD